MATSLLGARKSKAAAVLEAIGIEPLAKTENEGGEANP